MIAGPGYGQKQYQCNVVAAVARYYHDFLETNFRRTRAPTRQDRIRDGDGNALGFGVSRYPDLLKEIAAMQ
jgi:hypothetical protein